MAKNKKVKIFKVSLFFIIVGLVVYVFWNQFPPIINEIKKTNISTLVVLAFMGLLYQFIDGLSLRSISKSLGTKVSVLDSWGCSLYSAFYRVITFGSATYISIIVYFKRLGVEASKGFSISTVNYMAQKIAVVLTAIIMYLVNYNFMMEYFYEYQSYLLFGILITSIIVIVLILICVSEKFHELILMVFKLDKKNRFEDLKIKTKNSLERTRNATKDLLVDKVLVLKVILLNILKLSCWYVIPYIIFAGKFDYTFLDYFSITALAVSLIGVIPAPGAMGSTEFVFGLLFAVLMETKVAMSGVFLYRFANFIIPTICGGLVALYMYFNKKIISE